MLVCSSKQIFKIKLTTGNLSIILDEQVFFIKNTDKINLLQSRIILIR